MAKIVFSFAGTGVDKKETIKYAAGFEHDHDFQNDVIRVYIQGCQHKNVGGRYKPMGLISPNLDTVASKIHKAFTKDQRINIDTLETELGDAIAHIRYPKGMPSSNKHLIESVFLTGFSRGAVTTFAVAKKLDALNIPIHIAANQPVPGQKSTSPKQSSYTKYSDLTHCKNIKSATTLIASHHRKNGFLQDTYFRQMLARFPEATKTDNILIPKQGHFQDGSSNAITDLHIDKCMLAHGFISKSIVYFLKEKNQGSFFESTSTYEQERSISDDGEYKTCRFVSTSMNEIDACIKDLYQRDKSLYYTPEYFKQAVLKDASASTKVDKNYLHSQKQRLINTGLINTENAGKLTNAQIQAFLNIHATSDNINQDKQKLSLVLEQSDAGKHFVSFVNNISNICEYLEQSVQSKDHHKAQAVQEHAKIFKKTVFDTAEQLARSNNTPKDTQKFLTKINDAQKQFEKKATQVDRGVMRRAMKGITFIACAIVLWIPNIINAATNNNFFHHNHTRSTKDLRKAMQAIKKNVPQPNEENDSFGFCVGN